jgi:hypothetical protein
VRITQSWQARTTVRQHVMKDDDASRAIVAQHQQHLKKAQRKRSP